MLATSTFPSSSPHNFLPTIPSPLSPRRANGHFHTPNHYQYQLSPSPSDSVNLMNSTTNRSSPCPMRTASPSSPTTSPAPQPHTPFSARRIKAIPPTVQRSDALRERRRNIFLNKVRQDREDARWDNRVEDMAQLDYRSEKKRWEAEQALLARAYADPAEEVEEEAEEASSRSRLEPWHDGANEQGPLSRLTQQGGGAQIPDVEADEVLRRENEELEALVEMMEMQSLPQQQQQDTNETSDARVEHDGSSVFGGDDDDEYDSIFMDLIDERGGEGADQDFAGEEMDMS